MPSATNASLLHSPQNAMKAVALNAARLNFDGRVSFDRLRDIAALSCHDVSDPARPEEILERVAGHDVVINKEMPLAGALIARFPPCVRLICEAGTGFNNIDCEAARAKGIAVCNIPTYSTEAMAHMAITFVMAQSCSLVPQARALATGDRAHFDRCHLAALPHFELSGKTLGLVGGLGTIGRRVAAIAGALGMRVLASSRSAPPGPLAEGGIEVAPLEDLLRRSDFVSIHCPLTPDTTGLIDAAALRLMKPTAFLINTARGAIVDEAALVDALRERRIAGAALDVLGPGAAPPPAPPADHPLFALDNVILTPHIGWQRVETRQRVVEQVTDNVIAFAKGQPTNVVNGLC